VEPNISNEKDKHNNEETTKETTLEAQPIAPQYYVVQSESDGPTSKNTENNEDILAAASMRELLPLPQVQVASKK